MNKKIVAVVVAAGLVVGTSSIPTMATPLNEKLNQSKIQLKQSQNSLSNAQKKRQDLEIKVQDLDSKIENLMLESKSIEGKISNTQKDIENTKKELEQAKKELQKQQKVYNQRVRAMYVNGADSYLEVLLNSESFSDLISRVDMIKDIMISDKKIIRKLDNTRQQVNDKKLSLDTQKQKLVALKSENANKLAKMNQEKANENVVLASLIEEEKKCKDSVANSEVLVASAKSAIEKAMASATASASTTVAVATRPSRGSGYTGRTTSSSSSVSSSSSSVSSSSSSYRNTRTSSSNSTSSTSSSSSAHNLSGSSAGAAAASIAMGFQGVKYVWGGTSPSGFDCSGLVQYCFRQVGVSLPRTSEEQMGVGIPVSRSELKVGDLVFPHSGHVGIYVGNGCIVHAPHTGDVVKVSPIWKFAAGRRIMR